MVHFKLYLGLHVALRDRGGTVERYPGLYNLDRAHTIEVEEAAEQEERTRADARADEEHAPVRDASVANGLVIHQFDLVRGGRLQGVVR